MLVFLQLLKYHNNTVRDTNVNNCWTNQTFYTQLLKFAIMSKQALTSFPKEKINILFLENISEKAVQQFKQNGYANVKKIAGALSEDELIKEIKDVHLIGIRSKTQITHKVLAAAKKLQAIGCFCIGVNQVDIKAASKKGVVVFLQLLKPYG